jgi:hypothetical protein
MGILAAMMDFKAYCPSGDRQVAIRDPRMRGVETHKGIQNAVRIDSRSPRSVEVVPRIIK